MISLHLIVPSGDVEVCGGNPLYWSSLLDLHGFARLVKGSLRTQQISKSSRTKTHEPKIWAVSLAPACAVDDLSDRTMPSWDRTRMDEAHDFSPCEGGIRGWRSTGKRLAIWLRVGELKPFGMAIYLRLMLFFIHSVRRALPFISILFATQHQQWRKSRNDDDDDPYSSSPRNFVNVWAQLSNPEKFNTSDFAKVWREQVEILAKMTISTNNDFD